MNNIEKLAIEQGSKQAYTDRDDIFIIDANQLEAFAKAYAQQQSEPVAKPDAWLVPMILDFTNAKKVHFTRSEKGKNLTDDELKAELQGTVSWKAETVYLNDSNEPVTDRNGVRHYAKPLFTHPPASVPLEKYNKLLDAFKSARNTLEFANELGGPISDTIWHGDAQTLFDFMDSTIAEAEGKEG